MASPDARSLLLVDDDVSLCQLMREFFLENGMRVEVANDGRVGLARALSNDFDLIVLDVMLPGLDGFEILREIRRRSAVPVIMLTARIEHADRIAGLEAGADDYLPKPFDPDELLARVRAVLRRYIPSGAARQPVVRVGGLEVDSAARTATVGGVRLALTGMEFQILDYLVRAAGRVVSRDQLSTLLYQREATPFERSLDVHVSHLRKKLELPGAPTIKTIRGSGYLLAVGDNE